MMAAMKTIIPRLIALASLTLLAACNGAPQDGGGPVVASPPGEAVAAARGETAILPPPRTGPLVPEALKGLTAAQVEGELGSPNFRRRDPPAEIWQYRVRACTLDLFLYDDGGGRVVAHFAVRSPTGAGISDRACLDEVLARRAEAPAS